MPVTYDPPPIPLARAAATILTVRYNPLKSSGFFTPLPNVVCVEVQTREGAEPRVARFRYQFDQISDPAYPRRIEDVLGFDKSGPYVVAQDDRLCVLKFNDDGSYVIMFDGFAKVPQADLGERGETVTFQALGVEEREWDTPIAGAVFRNGPDPTVVSDVVTELPARANPDGLPNATPAGSESGTGNKKFPVFLDANLVRTPDVRAYYSVASLAKQIMGVGNPDETYTQTTANFADLDSLLGSKAPTAGDFFDPGGVLNVTTTPITCQDFDFQGDPWPVALAKLLRPHNLDFDFRLSQTSNGRPFTTIFFFRRDDADGTSPKTINLQAVGAVLDPGQTNVSALSIARDASQVANRIVLDTKMVGHECGLVLAPGFIPDIADLAAATLKTFVENDPGFVGGAINKYRTFVYSEAGDGYWDFPSSSWKSDAIDLDAVLGVPTVDPVTGKQVPQYARRRRKVGGKLFYQVDGKRISAELYMSWDFNQPIPCVWDGSGTWRRVSNSAWNPLPDRLGVRFTGPDPEDFQIGKSTNVLQPYASGKLRMVTSQTATIPPTALTNQIANPRAYFMLVCTIEADVTADVVADRRAASGSKYTITRRIDTRDRFFEHVVHRSSYRNAAGQGQTFITADSNYIKAKAFADGMRAAHENPTIAGSATIPRITLAYEVGDKIKIVRGRNIDLRTNGGAGQGEAATYPVVVGVSWTFDGQQSTHILYNDRRAEPANWHTAGHDYDD